MTVGSGDRLIQGPVIDLTRTRFSGGMAEFMGAFSDADLSPTLAPGSLDNDLFPSRFSGGTKDFLADLERVEQLPLPAELEGLQQEMHTWPLSRVVPEVPFRSRFRRMASSIFSIGNGLSKRSGVSHYTGRPSDFTQYTDDQQAHLFGPADDAADLEVQQPDPLPFALPAAPRLVEASNAVALAPVLSEKRQSSEGSVRERAGNMLHAKSRRLMVLGALALAVVGIGLFTSGGDGAVAGNHRVTAASVLPNRPMEDYNFMEEFTPHTKLTVPAETGSTIGAPDGTIAVSAAPVESGLPSDSKPADLSTFAEPIVLAKGDSVWAKVSERIEATGVSSDCKLTNTTAQIVATLRAINPTINLDILPSGEHDLGLTTGLLQQLLANSSAC